MEYEGSLDRYDAVMARLRKSPEFNAAERSLLNHVFGGGDSSYFWEAMRQSGQGTTRGQGFERGFPEEVLAAREWASGRMLGKVKRVLGPDWYALDRYHQYGSADPPVLGDWHGWKSPNTTPQLGV